MSEALNKIKQYRQQILEGLYNQCTPKQQALFKQMYGSVKKVPDDKIDWAIQQCERTVANNNKTL